MRDGFVKMYLNISYCSIMFPSTGFAPSTLHQLDWKTGVLRKSLRGETHKLIIGKMKAGLKSHTVSSPHADIHLSR